MTFILVHIIEHLMRNDHDGAVSYSRLLIEKMERRYRLHGDAETMRDLAMARNVMHLLCRERLEGGVAVLD